jgi:uncharacterized protein (UPF0332 family)
VNAEVADFLRRADEALRAGRHVLSVSPDAAGSRAYYAVFYAASALFANQGKTFSKHSALEAAIHRDLVRPGVWSRQAGEAYSNLARLRTIGDYGGGQHLLADQASTALDAAEAIVRTVKLTFEH